VLPGDAGALTALVRRCFPGFDALAPVVRELLIAPDRQVARLQNKSRRQRASLRLVRREAPKFAPAEGRRLAAVLQLLSQGATWQALREYWDMDGAEAAEASTLAIELLLEGARQRGSPPKREKTRKGRGERAENSI